MNRARVIGTGAAVPKKVLSNADLEKLVETSDEWITTRTGIKERRIVSEGEKFSDLCTKASEIALKRSHVKPEDLDMILVGTISSDITTVITAAIVPARGMKRSESPPRAAQRARARPAMAMIQPPTQSHGGSTPSGTIM